MRRYRVMTNDFDTRANLLNMKIEDEWAPHIREMWNANKSMIKKQLITTYGPVDFETKYQNFLDLSYKPFSVIAYHNEFFQQVRDSFVIGSYYPALTGACSLGERILNQLLITLRSYYANTPEYRKVYNKNSFDNWDLAINTLTSWEVLLPEVTELFLKLKPIRNRSIHFTPDTLLYTREHALEAIQYLSLIIETQFGSAPHKQPWYISGIAGGVTFIKKDAEEIPFVKEILIPNSEYVGYKHKLLPSGKEFIVQDDFDYEIEDLSDEEFKARFIQTKH
ncbi:hypothetical protein MH215_10120 [Paenibacillus sp. ACRSA]|uniref:hypothetical protein n=1 Tax=Paenibacillus sp. ACRSA TaxID=2918211 RepID=UPI001EF5315A|nr:hypothetical protein [Paenibacillus sp. ACRSA]MCG7377351.1 hypothetical protein [Paenibacillus sp. ACRSA]